MKKIQTIRLISQIGFMILTAAGFFISLKWTMAVLMLLTLVAGPFFCGWVCPYGALQDYFSRIGKKIGLKPIKTPKTIGKYLQYSRYIILAAFTIFGFDILFDIAANDPRTNFQQLLMGEVTSVVALVVIVGFGLISMLFYRPFCNYLCMEGAKYGVMSSIRIFTIKRNSESCINCKKCDKACPMNIEVSKTDQLRSFQCINCLECTAVCPKKDTLHLGRIRFDNKQKKRYITIGVFLAVILTGVVLYTVTSGNSFQIKPERSQPATELSAE